MTKFDKMKRSLALLGHSKLKGALRHTLLLIGMVLVSMGAYAQQFDPIPNGVVMEKNYYPDLQKDPTGGTGIVVLETYVRGSQITTVDAVPNDIVIVVDQSGSMSDPLGQGTRLEALKSAVRQFVANVNQNQSVFANKPADFIKHRIAIVGFASGNYSSYTNTELLTARTYSYYYGKYQTVNYSSLSGNNANTFYRNALEVVTDASIAKGNSHDYDGIHEWAIEEMAANGGTQANLGLEMAYEVLYRRQVKTFTDSNGNQQNRGQIVIFFTDGYPGRSFPSGVDQFVQNNSYYICQTTADAAVQQASNIKGLGATVYSIGVFGGANPEAAYRTVQRSGDGYNYWVRYDAPNNEVLGDAAANGYMHMVSSNYPETATNWTNNTGSELNVANRFVYQKTDPETGEPMVDDQGNPVMEKGKYFAAGNPSDLNEIFKSISDDASSEPYELSAGTIVQDQVSANFTLPAGASASSIRLYAPKCTEAEVNHSTGQVISCSFADTVTTKINGVIQYLTLEDGIVQDDDTKENRLNSAGIVKFVSYDENGNLIVDENTQEPIYSATPTKNIRITGFDFMNMFCGEAGVGSGIHVVGRKLVMVIPVVVDGGVWGDGISTNGPMSFVLPDGQTIGFQFNSPTTNVLGSVWTEVITTKPPTFKVKDASGTEVSAISGDGANQTAEISTPEDLAWFISEVNGRIGYNGNTNNVASHPKLNGKLTADIDMSRHNWVPIGCGWQVETYVENGVTKTRYIEDNGQKVHMAYEGTFDGNGYVITGLKNNASKYYKQVTENQVGVVVFPGMFSDVKGTVKNVFVLDADFRGKHHNSNFVHHGIIADTLEAGGMIFNCEAAGRLTCNNDNPTDDAHLIYGGLVGLNCGTVHSSMAMVELTGYTMGGMIGQNGDDNTDHVAYGSFANGFTNGVYNYLGVEDPVGGIAGKNISGSTINNCYVRFERENSGLGNSTFGPFVGNGSSGVSNCYAPGSTTYIAHWENSNDGYVWTQGSVKINESLPDYTIAKDNEYTTTVSPTFYHFFQNDNMVGGDWSTVNGYQVRVNCESMLSKLNSVAASNASAGWALWKRTTAGGYFDNAGNINGDYPVLQFAKFDNKDVTCLASADGIRIDYATSLKEMLHRHNNGNLNEGTRIDNEFTQSNSNYYKKTEHEAIYKGAINLFANDDVTISQPEPQGKAVIADDCTADGVVVYIDEDISLLQGPNSSIEAYTGQTLKSFTPNGKQRWHLASSSLKESKLGMTYGIKDIVPYLAPGESTIINGVEATYANPCKLTLESIDDGNAFFPVDLVSYRRIEFFSFFEKKYHWINFRRNSKSHWHRDNHSENIEYDNEDSFIKGKGYLVSTDMDGNLSDTKNAQFHQNRGTLNNGEITIPVTNTPGNNGNDYNGYNTGRTGYNLLGNPYQSYLDFDAFVRTNAALMGNSNFANTYAVYDPETGNWLQYKATTSKEATTADRYINMHQGFFIQVNTSDNITFNNDMRTNTAGDNGFRAAENHYPLINFTLTDSEGGKDIAVLEVGRPENDGAKKIFVSSSTGRLYLRHDSEDFAILFRDMTKGSQPLYFDAKENGTFTLSWNTANANFQSLTLVDNIAGVKYDMLTHDSYTFEGNTDNYKSRFKVVIGEFTDVEENEEPAIESNFAFFDGSEWVVNGQGQLDVVDMLGRTMLSERLTSDQNRVSLDGIAQGVYLMRVTNGNEVKVQKIVVR